MIVGIGERESGLDRSTIHDNLTGQILHGDDVVAAAAQRIAAGHSVDLGLMQINSRNLGLLGLTIGDAFIACKSVAAAARLLALFSAYNTGSPTRGIRYATRVMAAMDDLRGGQAPAANDQAAVIEIPLPKQFVMQHRRMWERAGCEAPGGEGNQAQ